MGIAATRALTGRGGEGLTLPAVAVYTDIAEAELDAFLDRYDVGRPIMFKGIAEGVENSNFLLETTQGRYILTIYERRARPQDLPFFLSLMSWLAGRGFPSATPVEDRDGRRLQTLKGKPAALVEFLSGLSVRRPQAGHCREAGRGLAWLHEAAEGFGERRLNDLGQAHWSELFEPRASAAEALKPGLAAVIRQDLAELARDWPRGLPEGIVHADLFPDNVFFLDGRFVGAIDFYFAAWDVQAYDLAVCLNAWCFEADGSFNVTKAAALIAGYRSRRPLEEAELESLPILARGAALRFFLTRVADWGAAPPGSLVRPKDPMEYERKLAVHRQGLDLAGLVR